ncbi:hypothetical protein FACS189447_06410 [Spirochaetia bacterium]|nr:hypothetical protein FACS189447_06410 [Spirochaetia bacterium]
MKDSRGKPKISKYEADKLELQAINETIERDLGSIFLGSQAPGEPKSSLLDHYIDKAVNLIIETVPELASLVDSVREIVTEEVMDTSWYITSGKTLKQIAETRAEAIVEDIVLKLENLSTSESFKGLSPAALVKLQLELLIQVSMIEVVGDLQKEGNEIKTSSRQFSHSGVRNNSSGYAEANSMFVFSMAKVKDSDVPSNLVNEIPGASDPWYSDTSNKLNFRWAKRFNVYGNDYYFLFGLPSGLEDRTTIDEGNVDEVDWEFIGVFVFFPDSGNKYVADRKDKDSVAAIIDGKITQGMGEDRIKEMLQLEPVDINNPLNYIRSSRQLQSGAYDTPDVDKLPGQGELFNNRVAQSSNGKFNDQGWGSSDSLVDVNVYIDLFLNKFPQVIGKEDRVKGIINDIIDEVSNGSITQAKSNKRPMEMPDNIFKKYGAIFFQKFPDIAKTKNNLDELEKLLRSVWCEACFTKWVRDDPNPLPDVTKFKNSSNIQSSTIKDIREEANRLISYGVKQLSKVHDPVKYAEFYQNIEDYVFTTFRNKFNLTQTKAREYTDQTMQQIEYKAAMSTEAYYKAHPEKLNSSIGQAQPVMSFAMMREDQVPRGLQNIVPGPTDEWVSNDKSGEGFRIRQIKG